MRRALLPAAAAALMAAAPAPEPVRLLDAANFDPRLLLPPPPTDDSPEGRFELEQLRRIDGTRTATEVEHARADGKVKSVAIFAEAMGPGFDLARLPATKALFDIVRAEEKRQADRAKDIFRRNRPWIIDHTLHPCGADDKPQSSYPSGHTTMAYAMAAILARLAPEKAPAIFARAADYARNRVVFEVHFPGDVAAGQSFGMMIAERLMQQPAFRLRFKAAARELDAGT